MKSELLLLFLCTHNILAFHTQWNKLPSYHENRGCFNYFNKHKNQNGSSTSSSLSMSSVPNNPTNIVPMERQRILRHNLAVSLDRPLLEPATSVNGSSGNNLFGGLGVALQAIESFLASLLISKEFLVTLVSLFSLSLLIKVLMSGGGSSGALSKEHTKGKRSRRPSFVIHLFRLLQGKMERIISTIMGSNSSVRQANKNGSVVMSFDSDDSSSQGWGVCTLVDKRLVLSPADEQPAAAKKKKRQSSVSGDEDKDDMVGVTAEYVEYTFNLPKPEYTLPLELGQQISLCCLDSAQNMAKGNFYPSSSRFQQGLFKITVPHNRSSQEMLESVGKDRSGFASLLEDELVAGDEVAIKPGPKTLYYKGQYLPVTDMLYFISDDGVIPILDQVKSVLPNGASSVMNVNVVWLNKRSEQFDVAYDQLEKEFYKFNSKLEVSCCLVNAYTGMEENAEISESVPNFRPGTMAVIAGPSNFVILAERYLRRRGYPKDVMCSLP